jgi:MOSC domain-containing protein YiiM
MRRDARNASSHTQAQVRGRHHRAGYAASVVGVGRVSAGDAVFDLDAASSGRQLTEITS